MAIVLAKVWPLEPGVKGMNPSDYSEIELTPGTPGFMEYEAAVAADKAGRVQTMAGRSWNELKKPRNEPKAQPKPATYRTADMQPATPESSTKDEDDKATYKTTEMKPRRGPGRPRKTQAS